MSEQKQGSNDGPHIPGMSMAGYDQQVGMGGQVTQVTMGHGTQVTMSQVAISQAGGMMTHAQGLPTLAPAPSSAGQAMQPGGPMHGMAVGQPGAPQGMPGQMIPQPMGQFQVIQQPSFPNGQYATMPQFASYNQQGQLVLTPAPQFTIPSMPGQQPGQQQIILTGVPQKTGQPHMLTSQPPGGGKTPSGQPCYTITSSGQLQMSGQSGQQPQPTFMLANPMASGMTGGGAGGSQQGQIIHTSMAGKDGKTLSGPGQVPGQQAPTNQQMVLQNMAYMPTQPHGNAIFQNGQILFRAPGGVPQDQQFMFSPNGQPATPSQAPVPHPSSMPPSNAPLSQMSMPVSSIRPPSSIPSGPPGKIAVSRALAPLLPTGSQTGPRSSYMPQNLPRQPSPKSKQKMSPPWRPGRPPAPNTANFKPKFAGIQSSMPRSPGSPMHPGSPMNMNPGSPMNPNTSSPRPPLNSSSPGPTSLASAPAGPPMLTPMMMPTMPLARTSTPPGIPISMPGIPISMPTMPTIPVISTPMSTIIPSYVPSSVPSQINQLPPLSLPSLPPPIAHLSATQPPLTSNISPLGPPTLTKEVTSPMPNLGPPNFPPTSQPKPLPSQVAPLTTSTDSLDTGLVPTPKPADPSLILTPKPAETALVPTPKAVVKPQVLTHVIDGHIIKESSQPFPISSKSPPRGRRKSDARDGVSPSPNGTVPNGISTNGNGPNVNGPNGNANNGSTKRGPGRPPGTTKNILDQQKVEGKVKQLSGEPPEKKQKNEKDSVAPLTNDREEVNPPVVPAIKDNPLKWNVLQVCDFIKNLPGCSDYAEDFALQEIDGQALMLLKADHLMSAMAIKLGPALKICSQIQLMREELHLN